MSQAQQYLFGLNWSLIEVRDFISRCFDRDALLATMLNYGSEWLDGRMICVVSGTHVQPFLAKGWASWGDDVETTEELATLRVTASASPVLEAIITQGVHTIGTPAQVGFEHFFEESSVLPADELVIIPLQLAGKTKMLLVGEPRRDADDLAKFSEDVLPLVTVAEEVARQLEEIIKLAKARKLPPAEERIPPLPRRISSASIVEEEAEPVEEPAPVEPEPEEEVAPESRAPVLSSRRAASTRELEAAISDALSASEEEEDPTRTPDALAEAASVAPGAELEQPKRSRRTLPIRIDARETSQLASLPKQDAREEDRGEGEDELSATHMGTPLHMLHQGMAAQEPVEDKPHAPRAVISRSALHTLPESPFERGELPTEPHPRPLRHDQSGEEETSGVSIIAPIGVTDAGKHAKQTLLGGFSLEDIQRAQERYEHAQQRQQEAPERARDTLQGISSPITADSTRGVLSPEPVASPEEDAGGGEEQHAPKAQILRRRRPHHHEDEEAHATPFEPPPSREVEEGGDDWGTRPTMQLQAASAEPPLEEPSGSDEEAPPGHKKTLMFGQAPPELEAITEQTQQGKPLSEFFEDEGEGEGVGDEASGSGGEDSPKRATLLMGAPPELAPEPTAAPEPLPEEGVILNEDVYATRKLHAITERDAPDAAASSSAPEEFAEQALEAPAADDISPSAEPSSAAAAADVEQEPEAPEVQAPPPLSSSQREALELIASRDRRLAFAAAERLEPHPEVLTQLEELFPGRLYVDRYQWTTATLPALERHGPVLAATLRLGEAASPMLGRALGATRLDTRFYAMFALTHLHAPQLLGAARERLFDRDLQTRELAQHFLLQHRDSEAFAASVLAPLRDELAFTSDDFHAEQAARLLGHARDVGSLGVLIDALQRRRGKIKRTIHTALQRITLQPLPAAAIAWRTWMSSTDKESRVEWILRAINSSSDQIRALVAEELAEIEGLQINYDANQPPALRTRTQQSVAAWFRHNAYEG